MAAMLTYHPRRGLLEATAAGRMFRLPTPQDHTRITTWEHAFELRPGKQTLWDHTFELPGTNGDATVIYRLAAAPGATDKSRRPPFHSHSGSALYVGTLRSGIYVHGWPPCNLSTCVIVLQQWDALRLAIASEKSLSFAVSV